MSVADIEKKIIITDCMTGKVIVTLPFTLISSDSLSKILEDISFEFLEDGFMVKIGY